MFCHDLAKTLRFFIATFSFSAYDETTICVGLARLGNTTQKIVSGRMKDLIKVEFGPPLHCLVIPGKTHPMEEEML